jgi:hypothetical protein
VRCQIQIAFGFEAIEGVGGIGRHACVGVCEAGSCRFWRRAATEKDGASWPSHKTSARDGAVFFGV